jgi:hypothetical protein
MIKTFNIKLIIDDKDVTVPCKYLEKDTFIAADKKFVIHQDVTFHAIEPRYRFSNNSYRVSEYSTGLIIVRDGHISKTRAKQEALKNIANVGKKKMLKLINSFQTINE